MSRKRLKQDKQHQAKLQNAYIRDFKPKTKGQDDYIRCMSENDVVLCDGPAGSGKTACSVALACEYLFYEKVKKIVVTRPVVESGYSLGALPGGVQEKIHEYLIPVLREIEDFFGPSKTEELIHYKQIELVPLNYMRGRNLHETFFVVDEAQNCTYDQLKMAISRIGRKSKCVISGDSTQCDLPHGVGGGFKSLFTKLDRLENVGLVRLGPQDIVRNPIIAHILERL
jgi:phosphate starvation-inducible PhoH-like protein